MSFNTLSVTLFFSLLLFWQICYDSYPCSSTGRFFLSPLLDFKNFLLSLVPCSLKMIYLGVLFWYLLCFVFSGLPGFVAWHCHTFGKFSVTLFQIVVILFSIFLRVFQLNIYIHIVWNCLSVLLHSVPFLYPLCFSAWGFSTALSLGTLIFQPCWGFVLAFLVDYLRISLSPYKIHLFLRVVYASH